MTATYENGIVPRVEIDGEFEQKIQSKFLESKGKMLEFFESFQFNQGLEQIFIFIRSINKYADERTPWKLAKSDLEEDRKKLKHALA